MYKKAAMQMRDRFSFPVVNEKNCFHAHKHVHLSQLLASQLKALLHVYTVFFSKAVLAKAGEIHCGLEKLPRRRGWLSPFSFLHIDRVLRVLAFGIAAMQLYFFFGLLFLHFLCVPWNFLLVLRERLKSHKYSHVCVSALTSPTPHPTFSI